MRNIAYLIYGILAYVLFFGVFLYFVGFTGGVLVPRSVDAGPESPLFTAVLIDVLLLGLFGVQHSVMARESFKRTLRRVIPAPLVRSTYVLVSSATLVLLMWGWRPIPIEIWSVGSAAGEWALWAVFALGWAILLISTFLIDHFELFGLKQVFQHSRGIEPAPPSFKTPGFYKFVRHPLMTGFLLGFWVTAEMTAGHVLFAGGMSAYIVIGTHLEERDLVRLFGERYRKYRERVPGFVPGMARADAAIGEVAQHEV